IDIAGEDKVAKRPLFCPLTKQAESRVRRLRSIQVHSMAKEAPGQRRIGSEPVRRGPIRKRTAPKGGIRLPETFRSSEVRQSGVPPHPSPGPDQQGLRCSDGVGRRMEARIKIR